jgi:hypothetical protein
MLTSAIENAGIQSLLDAVLSVEDVQVYKPHPAVYQLAEDRLVLDADEMVKAPAFRGELFSQAASDRRAQLFEILLRKLRVPGDVVDPGVFWRSSG